MVVSDDEDDKPPRSKKQKPDTEKHITFSDLNELNTIHHDTVDDHKLRLLTKHISDFQNNNDAIKCTFPPSLDNLVISMRMATIHFTRKFVFEGGVLRDVGVFAKTKIECDNEFILNGMLLKKEPNEMISNKTIKFGGSDIWLCGIHESVVTIFLSARRHPRDYNCYAGEDGVVRFVEEIEAGSEVVLLPNNYDEASRAERETKVSGEQYQRANDCWADVCKLHNETLNNMPSLQRRNEVVGDVVSMVSEEFLEALGTAVSDKFVEAQTTNTLFKNMFESRPPFIESDLNGMISNRPYTHDTKQVCPKIVDLCCFMIHSIVMNSFEEFIEPLLPSNGVVVKLCVLPFPANMLQYGVFNELYKCPNVEKVYPNKDLLPITLSMLMERGCYCIPNYIPKNLVAGTRIDTVVDAAKLQIYWEFNAEVEYVLPRDFFMEVSEENAYDTLNNNSPPDFEFYIKMVNLLGERFASAIKRIQKLSVEHSQEECDMDFDTSYSIVY